MREAEGAFGDADRLRRAGRDRPAAHRGADPRRRRGQRDPPLRARLLGAAPPPEGRRDRAGARTSTRRSARAHVRRRRARSPEQIGYRNAGTVEFLLDPRRQLRLHRDEPAHPGRAHRDRGGHRRRPRAVADAHRGRRDARRPRPRARTRSSLRGAALQCRITTEDPANGFRPDTGRITTYRSPGGAGVRLDGGTTYAGAEISRALRLDARQAHLPRAATFETRRRSGPAAPWPSSASAASRRTSRSCRRVLDDPDFRAGQRHHRVHRGAPRTCSRARLSADRGTRLLHYLADVTVNKPYGEAPVGVDPVSKLPPSTSAVPAPDGSRQRCSELGPKGSPPTCARSAPSPSPTPPSATRTSRCSRPGSAPATCSPSPATSPRMTPELLIARGWGGATYDVALRFLAEDPWERLAALREAVPNICLQMLLRGRNTVGYTPYPTEVTDAFVAEAGRDRHRHLPHLRRAQRRRADAPRDRRGPRDGHGGRRGRALLHRRPVEPRREALHARLLPRPRRADRRRRRARARDQGHGRPAACAGCAHPGRPRCGSGSTCPCTCTPTTPPAASSRPCSPRSTPASTRSTRRRAVDGRHDVAARAVVAGRARPTTPTARPGSTSTRSAHLEPYWEATRRVYAPFESGLPAPTGRVYRHEIPGGQLSNLRQQAVALGLGEKFEQIEDMYAAANDILGNIVKVTPSSQGGRRPRAAPGRGRRRPRRSSRRTRRGSTSPTRSSASSPASSATRPAAGPSRSATKALAGRTWKPPVGELTDEQAAGLAETGPTSGTRSTGCCSPARPRSFDESLATYGDVSVLPTTDYLYGLRSGEEHVVDLERGQAADPRAAGDQRARRARLSARVMCHDQRPAAADQRARRVRRVQGRRPQEKADPKDAGQVPAPFDGVVTLEVDEGDSVEARARSSRPSRR